MRILFFIFMAGSFGACLDSVEPDIGALVKETCFNEDSQPDNDVSFTGEILPRILMGEQSRCLDCHAPDAPTPIGFEVSGLNLSSFEGVRTGGAISGVDAIIPGRPCDSIVLQKIKSAPPFGARMPLDGPPYVSESDIQLLHDWIAEGAKNN